MSLYKNNILYFFRTTFPTASLNTDIGSGQGIIENEEMIREGLGNALTNNTYLGIYFFFNF